MDDEQLRLCLDAVRAHLEPKSIVVSDKGIVNMLKSHAYNFDSALAGLLEAHANREMAGRVGGAAVAEAMPAAAAVAEMAPVAKLTKYLPEMQAAGAAMLSDDGLGYIAVGNIVQVRVSGGWKQGPVLSMDDVKAVIGYDKCIENGQNVCSIKTVAKSDWAASRIIRNAYGYLPMRKNQNGRVTRDFYVNDPTEEDIRKGVAADLHTIRTMLEKEIDKKHLAFNPFKMTELFIDAEKKSVSAKVTRSELKKLGRNNDFGTYRPMLKQAIEAMPSEEDFCVMHVTEYMEHELCLQPGELGNNRSFHHWMLDQLFLEDRDEAEHAADGVMYQQALKGMQKQGAKQWLEKTVNAQMDLEANKKAEAHRHDFEAKQYRVSDAQIHLLHVKEKQKKGYNAQRQIMHAYTPSIEYRSSMHAEYVRTKDFVRTKLESSVEDARAHPRKFLGMNPNETHVGVRQYCLTLLTIFAEPKDEHGSGNVPDDKCKDMCERITAAMDAVVSQWEKSEKKLVRADVKEEEVENTAYTKLVWAGGSAMFKQERKTIKKEAADTTQAFHAGVKQEQQEIKKEKAQKRAASGGGASAKKRG